jgi:LuxR family maltose regulon positive regulatory protein
MSARRKAMAGTTDTLPLIRTKLYRPRIPGELVPRPRLLERLNRSLDRKLTLVSAPAGFGKTTLLATCLEACDRPAAWLQLDEQDSDLVVFLSYLLAAIQTLFADVGEQTQALLQAPSLPPLPILAATLLNELDRVDEAFLLVLDDYHNIQNDAVHELLEGFIPRFPPHMHLAIATRTDPPFHLANLRAGQQMLEIRARDLRFTPQEAHLFLATMVGRDLSQEITDLLEQKTEGWIVGLRLAALSMRGLPDVEAFVKRFEGTSSAYVVEYMLAEVLDRQSPRVREFLLRTSILGRFCAGLCDAVLDDEPLTMDDRPSSGEEAAPSIVRHPSSASRATIDELKRANLFLVPLDPEGVWYRYHHLFRDLLRYRLADRHRPDEIASFHARASAWFAGNGELEEALQHALAAGDTARAVQLVEQQRYNLSNTEQWNRLDRLLQQLPPESVVSNPKLLTTKAWCSMMYHSRWSQSLKDPDQIEELLLETSQESPERIRIVGEIDALRTTQLYSAGEIDRAISAAERTLRALHPEAHSMRGQTLLILAMAYQARGKLDQALRVIYDMQDRYALSSGVLATKLLMGLCVIHWLEGNTEGMKEPALQLLRLGKERNLPESATFGRYFLGCLHYVRNELAEAEPHFTAVVAERYLARAHYYAHCAFGQALCYSAWGHSDKARQVAESVLEYSLEIDNRWLVQFTKAFQWELALRQDRIAVAWQSAQGIFHDLLAALYVFYVPRLTEVKVLLKQNTPESRQEAAALLDNLHSLVVSTHNTRVRIDVLALQALLHDAQGEEQAALTRLTESLALAQPGGILRPFLDLGPEMATLLQKLDARGVADGSLQSATALHLNQVLTAFTEPTAGPATAEPRAPDIQRPEVPRRGEADGLVEALTEREMEVLALLARRLTNKEIAWELVIALGTVKRHTHSIYGKLGVQKRQQAVARARALGLLPPV